MLIVNKVICYYCGDDLYDFDDGIGVENEKKKILNFFFVRVVK